jgi:hypothetical protein
MGHHLPSVRSEKPGRERGNVLILSFLLVVLLAALCTAHAVTVQRSSRQSNYFGDLGELRRYAETGLNLAIHELAYGVGNGDGNIGTELWTPASDVGRDGKPGTGDEGEGDGIPTPGEPNLVPASVGPGSLGRALLVRTTDTPWVDVKRIVSTAFDTSAIAAIEIYAKKQTFKVPGVGAVYVQPGVALDVNGNAFSVTGNDTNPDKKPGPGSKVAGIVTSTGDPAGSNATALIDQVPSGRTDNITGAGGPPAVGETSAIDFDQVWSWFMAAPKQTIAPGSYSSGSYGDNATNDYRVTYAKGDLSLSGSWTGAGVLMVDGNLTLSGKAAFVGVVIVKGDVNITGGGNEVHVYGSLLVGKSPTDANPTLTISGNSSLVFSSLALSKASALIPAFYTVLFYNDLK